MEIFDVVTASILIAAMLYNLVILIDLQRHIIATEKNNKRFDYYYEKSSCPPSKKPSERISLKACVSSLVKKLRSKLVRD